MDKIKIAYCINTANESRSYIQPLLDRLIKCKQPQDEIIVVDDFSTNEETLKVLEEYSDRISLHKRKLEGSFAEHKNYFNELVSPDINYIFNIDSDELPHEDLLNLLPEILLNNPIVEVFKVPRVNIVKGFTEEDYKRYDYQVNENNWISFPDLQTRVYKVKESVKWVGKVHETLYSQTHAELPYFDETGKPFVNYCLLHIKDAERQHAQNFKYSQMM